MVNNAIAAAKAQNWRSVQFRYEEITVPYGFGKYWGTQRQQPNDFGTREHQQ